jgi:hypothetical protein
VVSVLAIGPKIRELKPGPERCIFKATEVRSTASFGAELKPSFPRHKNLQHVKKSLRSITEILRLQNERTFLAKFLPASLLDVHAAIFQKALVNESGMITTQMGMHNRSDNGRNAWEALYDTTKNA